MREPARPADRTPRRAASAWLGKGAWTVLDQGLFAGSNFALNVLLARWLAPEAYGSFTLVSFAALLLVGVLHTGVLTEPMLVFGPGRFRDQRRSYVRHVLWGHLVFALATAVVLAGVGWALGVFAQPELTGPFLALAVAQGGILLMWMLRRACYVFFRPATAVVGGMLYALVMALGLLALWGYGWLSPAMAILLMGAASLAASVVIVLRLGLWEGETARAEMKAEAVEAHRSYGGWASATGGLEWVQGVLPFLVLPLWHGLEATGAFRALFNLVMPVMHAYGALSLLLVPTFVRARESGRLRRSVGVALGVVLGATVSYGLVIAFAGGPVLDLVYGGTYTEYAGLLGLFALYPVFGGAATVLGALHRSLERPQRVFRARAGAAGLMTVGGTLVIRSFGVLGAILADALASLTETLLLVTRLRDEPRPQTNEPSSAPSDPDRLKVLVSAFACIPGWGTEPGVGWNVVREMARHHDVWVLTYAGFRKAIEAELAERPVPRLHFAYYKLPFEHARYAEEGNFRSGLAEQAQYYAWQLGAARVARRLHAEVNFDLAHHVTFVKYWAPCALAGLPIPVIWGPVGGGESAPRSFYRSFSPTGVRYERRRDLARGLMHLDPNVRRIARTADLAFATTEETAERMRRLGADGVEVRSAIGLSTEECTALGRTPPPDDGPLRFISMGRFLAFKGFRFSLMAFAEAARGGDPAFREAEYWLLGDGPEREHLAALAASLGVADRVRFFGVLPRPEALERLGEAHVLVHPSLHESGGGVCLEAMAAGRPVLCLDLGGSAVHVSHDAGIRIPATEPDQVVRDLAFAMRRLAASPSMRQRMGAAGQARVTQYFCWEDKVAAMAARYWTVVGRTPPFKPAARMPMLSFDAVPA